MNGSDAIQAVAQALLHFLWQGVAVGLVTGWLLTLLTRAKASTRYAVSLGALLLMTALPVATALRLAGSPAPPAIAVTADVVSAGPSVQNDLNPGVRPAAQSFGASLLAWVVGFWLAGVAGLSLYHLAGWRLTRRLSRQGLPLGGSIAALARELCGRLRIDRAVALLESSAVSVPMVVGWLRPVVLIPASAMTGLSPQQLEAILAHELAHVRRHDYLINLFQTALETLLFYHPAVWWVSTQVRRERENCCDDLAVAVSGDRLGYVRALVDLEGLRSGPRLALAATGGSLSDRVRRLVGAPRRPARRSWAAGLVALTLLPAGAAVQLACHHRDTRVEIAGDATGRHGTWLADLKGDRMRLEVFQRKEGWGSWTSVDEYPVSWFAGFAPGRDSRFELRRDAGIFRFQGSFEGTKGRGTFTFTPNVAYAKAMGYGPTNLRLLDLALSDVSLDYVRQMRGLGYDQIPSPKALSHHGVFQFFHHLMGIERPDTFADRLAQFRRTGITPEYARGIREAGYLHLQPWQLVELRNHGIEAEYVKGVRASGYRNLFPFRVVEMHDHGITPEWLSGIVEAGFADVAPDQLISLHDHGIDGGFIRKARAAGYQSAGPEELIGLRVRGKV